MPSGPVISRDLVFLLKDGRSVVDWSDGLFQDILSGDFFQCQPTDIGQIIPDEDLEILVRARRVESYDHLWVYLYPLPELPRDTLS
jgi:hypothetical protein